MREIARDLSHYARDADLASLPALTRVMQDYGHARRVLGAMFGAFMGGIRQQQLGEVPFRHSSSPGFSRLQLLQSGGAVLSLCVYEPLDTPCPPVTAQFADCELSELVLAGAAKGHFHRLERTIPGEHAVRTSACRWKAGDTISPAARTEARQFEQVEQSLLLLQLTRTPAQPCPTREVRIDDGALVREASGNRRASEQLMALGVLGALGRPDTIAPMIAFARNEANDRDARWEAVRQTLAMDAAQGFSLLCAVAQSADDDLSQPAAALKEQLLDAQPILRQFAREHA